MIDFFGDFLGGEVRTLDCVWVRNVRVGSATGCHIDCLGCSSSTARLTTGRPRTTFV